MMVGVLAGQLMVVYSADSGDSLRVIAKICNTHCPKCPQSTRNSRTLGICTTLRDASLSRSAAAAAAAGEQECRALLLTGAK